MSCKMNPVRAEFTACTFVDVIELMEGNMAKKAKKAKKTAKKKTTKKKK